MEILLEVENLTVDERAQVQDGLTTIRSGVTEASANNTPESEIFSDLSALISVCYRHQSEEEANAVRIARAQTTTATYQGKAGGEPHIDSEQEGVQVQHEPHRPQAASQDSERRQLAKKINCIIKASMEDSAAGNSTGLNRRARWNMEKLAAGSTLAAGETVTVTGNSANSQAAAQKAAQAVCFSFGEASVTVCQC